MQFFIDVANMGTHSIDADEACFGNSNFPSMSCTHPIGFVVDSSDCNDANSNINPGANEICNFIDDDCDGLTDEGETTTLYLDLDEDGFGDPAVTAVICDQPTGYVGKRWLKNTEMVIWPLLIKIFYRRLLGILTQLLID